MSQEERQTAQEAGRDDEARSARLAALREEDARKVRRGKGLRITAMVVGAVAVVGIAAAALFSTGSGDDDGAAESSGVDPDKVNVRGEKVYKDLKAGHVDGKVDYGKSPNPPVGGPHNPTWQNANGDVYTKPLKNEHAVHALEHGAVWVTYSKSAEASDIKALKDEVEGAPYRMLSPVPDQDTPVMLSAWGHQLSLKSATDPRLDEFLKAYVQGPQAPEPGASVTGGRATP